MKNTQNATIAVLCVSAAILATVVVLMHVSTDTALADAAVRGGDYIMVTGAYSKSTDIVYIIDGQRQMLNAYVTNVQDGRITIKDQVNLRLLFKR